jgi:hypothetical protein
MKIKTIFLTGMIVLAATPAYAIKVAPGPEAGAGLAAMALVVTGYLALRRRIGR